MTDYFLDTCIFLAYAYHFDPYNAQCVKFFDENFSRFTGKRVKSELEGTLRRRKQLYVALASHLGRGGSAKEFISRRKDAMNTNDKRHFEHVLCLLDVMSPTQALTYIRDMDNAARKGIDEAFQKVQHPLIDFAYVPACESKIYAVVQHRLDAKILVDALYWSQNRSPVIFLTLDWTDFISQRAEIMRAIRKYLKIGASVGLPLKIRHINEIS